MPKLGPRKELGEDFMERYNRVWWLIQSLHYSSWTTKFDTFLYNENPFGSKIIGPYPSYMVASVKSA
jgi:lysozyme family protein